ncbi:MAG: hypothetical protein DMG57_30685 [Acidobacteria bacterium]|nr:MAG: hypothetical protein DMG57_30685 [Acidobacteriota bacterium]
MEFAKQIRAPVAAIQQQNLQPLPQRPLGVLQARQQAPQHGDFTLLQTAQNIPHDQFTVRLNVEQDQKLIPVAAVADPPRPLISWAMGDHAVGALHGIHPAPQPALVADHLQVLQKAGFQILFREAAQRVQQRFRIDHSPILGQTAVDFFRCKTDPFQQVGVLEQRTAMSRRVPARHLPQAFHSMEQGIANSVVLFQVGGPHPGGRGPQAAAQHEIQHRVEAPPLRVEHLEGPSFHNLLCDSCGIFLPKAETAGAAGRR